MALARMLVITLFFIVFALSSTTTNPTTSTTSSAGVAFAIAPSSFKRRMPSSSSSSSRARMKQPVKRRMMPSSRTRRTTRESDKKTNSFSESNGVDIGSSGSGNEGEATPSVVKEGEGGGNNMDNAVDATDVSDKKKANNAFEPQPHWKKGFEKMKERRSRFPPSKQPSAKGKAWIKPSDLTKDPNLNEEENHETINRAATQGGKAVPTLPSQRSKKGIWRAITGFASDLFLFNKGKKNYIIVLASRIIFFIVSLYIIVRIYKNRLKIMKKVGLGSKGDDYYLSR